MKKLIKPFVFLAVLLVCVSHVDAQRWKMLRYEMSVGIGSCNIFGDVGGSATQENLFGLKDIQIAGTRPSLVLGFRYKIIENMALKANVNFCFGAGSDAGSKNARRGYTFSTFLSEQSIQYEYYFAPEDKIKRSSAVFNKKGMINNYSTISAYVFGGGGGAYYVPSLKGFPGPIPSPRFDTKLGSGYSGLLLAGIGAKLVYSDQLSFNAELGGRYALSDGLDGLTTISSKSSDIYWLLNFSICYRIKTDRNNKPDFRAAFYSILHRR